MSARNDITGEPIQSKSLSKQGRDNYDDIFRKKTKSEGNEKQTQSRGKSVLPETAQNIVSTNR
jgi:hypothetical protein